MSLTGGDTSATLAYTVGNFTFFPIDPVNMGKLCFFHYYSIIKFVFFLECTLDVQYIMGIAPGVPTSFFVVDGYGRVSLIFFRACFSYIILFV